MTYIYFIGFMGSGKSTIARLISQRLAIPFIDIDNEIEFQQKRKIVDIFQEDGEEVFRLYETKVLKEITDKPLISTGGGVVEKNENINYMKQNGIIIYLKTSFSEISSRLAHDHSRPLWKDDTNKQALFDKRIKLYNQIADFIVDGDKLTLQEQVNEIIKYIRIKRIINVKDKHNSL
ncbi:shikimate kinase [Ornithinibacillus xuwenensis]|jgi:shikimate kinase|uniref:Shikimate kinase n=1 Tax=Ornithinibacillus xuwenensis TaxID=3144668 RepID=A0ABU9XCK1_9BACI